MKKITEWNVRASWGNIAMVSWGDKSKTPILLLHGYMDSAATFIPLINMLPDDYYYVSFDMPGHGKSDPFPKGNVVSTLVMVEPFKRVIKHMKWKQVDFMAHSMGCIIGLFYNHVYPGVMKSMVFLDPGPPISMYYYFIKKIDYWFMYSYSQYYDNYERYNSGKSRLYTYDEAISLVVRSRSLTEEKAEIILSRSLINIGIDAYKLSWDPRMKKITSVPISEEILYTVMTANSLPTLCFDASESNNQTAAVKFGENLLRKSDETLSDMSRVTVKGGHDVHITHPEFLVPHIVEFYHKLFLNRRKVCKL